MHKNIFLLQTHKFLSDKETFYIITKSSLNLNNKIYEKIEEYAFIELHVFLKH
jgi:hypothetical protein